MCVAPFLLTRCTLLLLLLLLAMLQKSGRKYLYCPVSWVTTLIP